MKQKNQDILLSIYNTLHSETFKSTHKNDEKSFLRKRVLGFIHLIQLQLNQLIKSLSIEMNNALKVFGFDSLANYSKQAFSRARQKLNYSTFVT